MIAPREVRRKDSNWKRALEATASSETILFYTFNQIYGYDDDHHQRPQLEVSAQGSGVPIDLFRREIG